MYARPLPPDHPDYLLLSSLAAALVEAAGGWSGFLKTVPPIFRAAIDEVIDAPRTGRMLIEETEKTEKTYLGTKIEILFRDALKLEKGQVLDLQLGSTECDIKHTMGSAWSIPAENIGRPAVLLRESEATALCDVGLVFVRPEYLNAGQNRDAKKTISAQHEGNIWWLLRGHPYPANFWLSLTLEQRGVLRAAGAPTRRLAALFEMVPGQPVPRSAVEALANQLDPLKRIRRNGGARDLLAPKGIALLFGKTDREVLNQLGYTHVSTEQFVSHIPRDEAERALLRAAGHID